MTGFSLPRGSSGLLVVRIARTPCPLTSRNHHRSAPAPLTSHFERDGRRSVASIAGSMAGPLQGRKDE